MSSFSDMSSGPFELLIPTLTSNQPRLQPTVTKLVANLSISNNKHQPEALATMPGPVTSPSLSGSEDKQQSVTAPAMTAPITSPSEDPNAATGFSYVPKNTIEIDGITYVRTDKAAGDHKCTIDSFDLSTTHSGIAQLAGTAPVSDESVKISWALPFENEAFMSSESALAFLGCNENSSDELVIKGFNSTVMKYPATVDFARQAVKVIADARGSNVLLKWLAIGALGGSGRSSQRDDKAGDPDVISPLSGQIRNGIRSFPFGSIGQAIGPNLYFNSKPVSVIVGESKETYYIHHKVLAISPVLEKVCETEEVKKTASIELPEDDPAIFEYVLGYLYFQDYTPPTQARSWETTTPNEMIMKTYAMAAKYEVEGLKPLLLKSFNLEIPINQFCRLIKVVYDSRPYDPLLGQFFKDNIVATLEKTLAGSFDDQFERLSYPYGHVHWGGYGGSFGTDLMEALLRKVSEKQDTFTSVNEACEDCDEVQCQCDPGCEDREYNGPGPSYYDDQCYNDDQYKSADDETYEPPPETAPKNQVQEADDLAGIDWGNIVHTRDVNHDVKGEEFCKEMRALKDEMSLLIGQLGNLQGSDWGPDVRRGKMMSNDKVGAAKMRFGLQAGEDGHTRGLPIRQGRNGWGAPLPASASGPLYPPMHTQFTSGGRTAIAIQASTEWDGTLTFPPGAIITDVDTSLGSRYSGRYCGRFGEFPGRFVHLTNSNHLPGGGW